MVVLYLCKNLQTAAGGCCLTGGDTIDCRTCHTARPGTGADGISAGFLIRAPGPGANLFRRLEPGGRLYAVRCAAALRYAGFGLYCVLGRYPGIVRGVFRLGARRPPAPEPPLPPVHRNGTDYDSPDVPGAAGQG